MRISFPALMGDAWKLWRSDWEVLTAVAGMFVFLPALAKAQLIPDWPMPPQGATLTPGTPAADAFGESMASWLGHYGWGLALVAALASFGQFALVALYLSGDRPPASRALIAAARRFPTLILAWLIVMIPLTLIGTIVALAPILLPAFAVLFFWILARTATLAPVLFAEAPIGAWRALIRSLHLTRGNTLALAAAIMTVFLAASIASWPFQALDAWMAAHAPNPVARTMAEAFVALLTALDYIAMAVLQVAAYRRIRAR